VLSLTWKTISVGENNFRSSCEHEGIFFFFLSFEAEHQTQPHKVLLAPPSQVHWQRAGRSFPCTPLAGYFSHGFCTRPLCYWTSFFLAWQCSLAKVFHHSSTVGFKCLQASMEETNKNIFWPFLEVETWTLCQHPTTCSWSGGMVKIWTPAKHILGKNLGEVHISNFRVVSTLLENSTNHSLAPAHCMRELKSSFQHIKLISLGSIAYVWRGKTCSCDVSKEVWGSTFQV